MFHNIKRVLRNFYYTYILGKPVKPSGAATRAPVRGDDIGVNGRLVVDALLVRDTDRDNLILVVDADLRDIPVWADFDRTQNAIGIAQQNGAYATLTMKIEKEHETMLKTMKRISVVTKVGDMNIVHQIPFITRD